MPPEVREYVMARDNYSCQAAARGYAPDVRCSSALHAHHVILRSQGGRDHPDDLLTVCRSHHDHLHNVDRSGAERFGLIQRRR